MKIDSVIEKGSSPINEDFLLIKNNLYGVFDGMSSLVKYEGPKGETGGFLAGKIAKDIFSKNQNKPLANIARDINKKLREEMKKEKINFNNPVESWSTTVAVIRIVKNFLEYLQIGDSPIIIIYKNKPLDIFISEDWDKESLALWKKLAQEGVLNIRNDERMVKQLVKVRRRLNIDYGSLNGQDDCFKFAQKGSIPLIGIRHVLLFTDGFFIPDENPRQNRNFNKIVELFSSSGLSGVKNYVRQIENSDPACINYPRFRKNDEVAAIAISF